MDIGTIIGVVFGSLALILFILCFVAHKIGLGGSTVTVGLVNLQLRHDNMDPACHSDVGLLREQREETGAFFSISLGEFFYSSKNLSCIV